MCQTLIISVFNDTDGHYIDTVQTIETEYVEYVFELYNPKCIIYSTEKRTKRRK